MDTIVETKYVQKSKKWNMMLLIIIGSSAIFDLMTLPTLLNPDKGSYDLSGAEGARIYDLVSNPIYKIFNISLLVCYAALFVLFIVSRKGLKSNLVPAKYPYYLWGVVLFLTILSDVFFPTIETTLGPQLVTTVLYLLLGVPALMAVINLFKAEPE